MEVNFTSFIDVPSGLIITAVLVCALSVFYITRFHRPVKANCWFCNNNSYIWREQLDWWFCTFCEQYNGFTEDGDYNNPIPAQKKSSRTDYTLKTACKTNSSKFTNKLCDSCNKKEELKLRKRRELERNGIDSQSNIKKYIESFEKKYPLCKTCDFTVKKVLHSQSRWLVENKMLSFRERSISMLTKNTRRWALFMQVLLMIFNFAISFEETMWPSLIGGLVFQFVISLTIPARRKVLDTFLVVFWICMIGLAQYPELDLLTFDWIDKYFPSENIKNHRVVMLLRVILGLSNFIPSASNSKSRASFKKLEIALDKSFSSNPNSSLKNEEESTEICQSPVNITDSPPSLLTVQAPVAIKPLSSRDYLLSTPSNLYKTSRSHNFGAHSTVSNSRYRHKSSSKRYQNSCVRSLSTLSLADTSDSQRQRQGSIFSTKSYKSSIPELFKRQTRAKRNVLAPPKFQPQNSWPTLSNEPCLDVKTGESASRSSSRSSGFSSVNSEETCFEQDRASLFAAEPTTRLRNSVQRDFQYGDYSVNPLERSDSCYSSLKEHPKMPNLDWHHATPSPQKQIWVTIGIPVAIYFMMSIGAWLIFKYLP